jgi:RNA polymerase sigma factor for flagellar operon FliA
MLDYLREEDPLPRHRRAQVRRIDRVRRNLEQRLGRRADEAEIATASGMSLEDYQRAIDGTVVFLRSTSEPELHGLPAPPPAERSSPELLEALQAEVEKLPKRTRQIFRLYYEDAQTFGDLAPFVGISRTQASILHNRALSKLRARLRRYLSDDQGRTMESESVSPG